MDISQQARGIYGGELGNGEREQGPNGDGEALKKEQERERDRERVCVYVCVERWQLHNCF